MPMQWESPKPIEEGLAQALANYIYGKSGKSYLARSLDIPVQELTEQDLEGPDGRGLAIWWSWVRDEWEEFKRDREKEEERKKLTGVEKFRVWLPLVMFFGDPAVKEINRRGPNPKYQEAIDEAEKDLRTLIGFKAYAYRKSDYREPPESKHLT